MDILDPDTLRAALATADLRVLIMALFQVTGDESWLAFRPARDVTVIADEAAGFSPEVQAEIRAAAYEALKDPAPPRVTEPDEALLLRMLRICLGEEVGAEYAPLFHEEMGFVSRDARWSSSERGASPSVLIVGAGASGIALGARLGRLGIDYRIVERHADVGGVWYENRYPGCGVDTPNHSYSYSFGAPYPWRRYFSDRDQVQDYLRRSADAFDVRRHVSFSTEVLAAEWRADERRWRLTTRSGGAVTTIEASILVSAIGQFGVASMPAIPGVGDFKGPIFHSTQWPDGLDIDGKRVAIIGTGASSMQIVPSIVDQVSALTIYQRSAQWVRPMRRHHEEISDSAQWLMAHVPYYAAWFRTTMWWRYGDGLLPQLRRDPNWPHKERSVNRANERRREEMVAHIRQELVGRNDLLERCVPDYPPFGKRILLDNGWYAALRRREVDLVTGGVTRITETGIVAEDGAERAADIVVLATGFQLGALAARLNITGRDGIDLAECWKDDNPSAYLGIAVPGFPNLFLMGGPNTGLGHGGSTIFQAESQARYISSMLVAMTEQGLAVIEVRQDAHDAFVAQVDAEHAQLIWTHPGVATYYKNAAGRVFSAMPFRLVDYWRMTREADLDRYHRSAAAR